MGNINKFSPIADTVTVSASSTSANASLPGGSGRSPRTARIVNPLSEIIFVKFSVGVDAADSGDIPVLANSDLEIEISPVVDTVNVVTLSGSGAVYVQVGMGGS